MATGCCLEGGILKYLSYNSVPSPPPITVTSPVLHGAAEAGAILGRLFLCLGLLAALGVGGGRIVLGCELLGS